MSQGNPFGARAREFSSALASVIFPAPCRICGELLDNVSRVPFCTACLSAVRAIQGPICGKCGRPFVSGVVSEGVVAPLCGVCRRNLYGFDFARSFAIYTPKLASAILLLKYEEMAPLGRLFAKYVAGLAQTYADQCAADVVVPVPLHPARLRERGHNQAELIVRPLAKLLGLQVRSYLLVRTRPRPEKLRLTLRERWRSVRGAYAIRGGKRVDNLRVLLVDDVMTTGATLDACSRALKRAGASYVAALTVARALPRGEVSP